jgi:hypothetical protein
MKQNRPGHIPPRSPPRMRISCSCDVFACAGEVVWDGSRAVVGTEHVSKVLKQGWRRRQKVKTNEDMEWEGLGFRVRTHCLRSDRLCCLQVGRRGASGVLICRRHLGLSGGI